MRTAREIMWRRTMDDLSFEHARFERGPDGIVLSGTVMAAEGGKPLRLDYRVDCGADWRTRSVTVTQVLAGTRQTLRLDYDGDGAWSRDGRSDPSLDGCTDVDLGLSPITNALPVNRLGLAIGATGTIRATWIRFPSLEVVPAEQCYDRLAELRYRYRSLTSGFEAEIEVDEDGLPVDYAGIWRRVADGPAHHDATATFTAALASTGPSPDLGSAADDLAWLTGGWRGAVLDFDRDGTVRTNEGEWWFGWVLEGRALQDIWIVPPRGQRAPSTAAAGNRYGSTLRWYDKAENLWRIVWINPVTGAETRLSGRRSGDRVELLGQDDGRAIRWCFNEITADGFVWTGESQDADGRWFREAEFRMRRIP